MERTEVKISGLGGQGVILSGMIIGRAATIYAGKHATMIQSFGPEARGSACAAQLVISDAPILYPYVKHPQILVSLSGDAYQKYRPELADGGLVLLEEDLVRPNELDQKTAFRCPATRLAEKLGRGIVLNIVMVGFFAAVTQLLEPEAFKQSVEASVPPMTVDLNLRAFDQGFAHGQKLLEG